MGVKKPANLPTIDSSDDSNRLKDVSKFLCLWSQWVLPGLADC